MQEQHLFEDLSHPHTWGGANRWHRGDSLPTPLPLHFYQPSPAVPLLPQTPPQAPLILQQTVPRQPATIIQQLPQQQPLITQIPPPQPFPASKSGSIKEDMVELMLMQNAQMHQIIMHNMMLKAIPPLAFSSVGGASQATPTHQSTAYQEKYQVAPIIHRVEKCRGSSVHHHHHYSPAVAPPLPLAGYAMWSQVMPLAGQEVSSQPSVHHIKSPVTLPPLHM
ncbi:hypothetical protein Z043_110716 [Scleropages formosus]|uniref:DUF4587 domain-containing protein n=1 Tax=Scleropages formosus TaxID=113540 RepID=A0A0P7V6J7_SCLFO|nr:hypothetical protein Z043_110716 [Scleropages formosus]